MKLLIADGSTAHRRKIVQYMNYIPGLEIVGEAKRPTSLVRSFQRTRADVVVLDLASAGERDSVKTLKRLKEEEQAPFVIVLAPEGGKEARRARYRRLGADLVFDREQEIDKTLDALEGLGQLTESN